MILIGIVCVGVGDGAHCMYDANGNVLMDFHKDGTPVTPALSSLREKDESVEFPKVNTRGSADGRL